MQHQPTASLAQSSIWEATTREELLRPQFKKSDLDYRRQKVDFSLLQATDTVLTSQLGIPGSQLRPIAQDNRIPLLLIQRSITSPTSPNESSHGFTVLLPRGWSMYFLSSFVYAGSMIGGLVERRNQYRECGVPSFPEHYSDTCPAGREWEEQKAKEERERWEKKPPAKRPQYSALGTNNPWKPDWQAVLRDRTGNEEEVEMNGRTSEIQQPWLFTRPLLDHIVALVKGSEPERVLLRLVNTFRSQRGLAILDEKLGAELYSTALVQVKVEMDGRGSPGDMAIIYALEEEARGTWLEAKARDGQYGRADWLTTDAEPKSQLQQVCQISPLV
jgi:ribonuclease P/MRP protein subunit POP1